MPTPSNAQRGAASLLLNPVDLRHLLTPCVRAQGPRPLCLPFSTSVAHEAARAAAAADPPEELSVEPLWQHCVQAGTASHDGTTVRTIADAIEHTGQTLETIWPYNDTLAAGTEPTPAAATVGTFNTVELLDVPLAHDRIETNIENTLAAGLPIIVVIEVTTEFENPSADGEIDVPSLSAPINDYHAVTAVGAATNAAGTARRLLIRNSWGPGWGAGGYGWLPYDYLVAFAGQAAAIDPRTLATR
jgi:C1A family cysteine protease